MIFFWLVCAVFVAIALAFILPSLLQSSIKGPDHAERREANIAIYRDQLAELSIDLANGLISPEQYQQDRTEMERRMLADVGPPRERARGRLQPASEGRGAAYVVAIGLPILAVALYLRIGSPNLTPNTVPSQPTSGASSATPDFSRIEANVAALAKRLEQNSNDVQGWTMLARSYSTLEKYNEASLAYARATALKPNDADLWAEYAFAVGMANGEKLTGQAQELIAKALKLDPENPKALELAGSAAFEAKDYKRAADYWQRLLDKLPPESEIGQSLSQRISRAQALAGNSPAK